MAGEQMACLIESNEEDRGRTKRYRMNDKGRGCCEKRTDNMIAGQ